MFEKLQKSSFAMISLLLIIILLVAVTVTWFVLGTHANVNELTGKVSDWDLIVSTTSMGDPITDDDKLVLNVDDFTNVTNGKLAPGTTGTIEFYARSNSDVVAGCSITLDKSALTLEGDGTDYSEVLQNHLRFYTDDTYTTEIDMENAYTAEITMGEEKKITVYWRWLYEGDEIMPDTITAPEDIKTFLKNYDDEDCLISKYRDSISGNIVLNINAYGKEPETSE